MSPASTQSLVPKKCSLNVKTHQNYFHDFPQLNSFLIHPLFKVYLLVTFSHQALLPMLGIKYWADRPKSLPLMSLHSHGDVFLLVITLFAPSGGRYSRDIVCATDMKMKVWNEIEIYHLLQGLRKTISVPSPEEDVCLGALGSRVRSGPRRVSLWQRQGRRGSGEESQERRERTISFYTWSFRHLLHIQACKSVSLKPPSPLGRNSAPFYIRTSQKMVHNCCLQFFFFYSLLNSSLPGFHP